MPHFATVITFFFKVNERCLREVNNCLVSLVLRLRYWRNLKLFFKNIPLPYVCEHHVIILVLAQTCKTILFQSCEKS